MNRTNFEHAAIAVALQLLALLLFWDTKFNSLELGAAFAIGGFLFREHAQREYQIGDPSKLYGYEALDFWRWKLDAHLDWLCPMVAVLAVALLVTL